MCDDGNTTTLYLTIQGLDKSKRKKITSKMLFYIKL